MESLPDDQLLLVLGFLRPGELLLARSVCRRWRDLALDPRLWENKSVGVATPAVEDEIPEALLAAIIRLAPCIGTLALGSLGIISKRRCLLLASASCAVTELYVRFCPTDSILGALLLRRFASLGKLKALHVCVDYCHDVPLDRSRIQAFFRQLLHTEGLAYMTVLFSGESDPFRDVPVLPLSHARQVPVQAPPSVECFRWMTAICPPHLPQYLQWQAATLETVDIWTDFPGMTSLLAAAPRLEAVGVPLAADLPALLRCPALRALKVVVDLSEATKPHLFGLRALLAAAAPRLEDVVLAFPEDEHRAEAFNVLRYLAGSGAAVAALRSLAVYMGAPRAGSRPVPRTAQPPHLGSLAAVLRRLPGLVRLAINGAPSPAFLAALDGHAAPRLQALRTAAPLDCHHQWAHSQQVRLLLQRYPRLQLTVEAAPCDEEAACAFCEQHSCHSHCKEKEAIAVCSLWFDEHSE